MTTTISADCIDTFNALLRGELSAIETYTRAIDKFDGQPEADILRGLRTEHIESANRLRHFVKDHAGVASTDSGAWGTWAKAVENAATLIGERPALAALLQGEEYGRASYEDALDTIGLVSEGREIIRAELLPRQYLHIQKLTMLKQTV